MKKKYKLLIVLFVLTFVLFASSLTYSIFNNSANLGTTDQKIAQFVFNAQRLDNIELPLTNLNPGESTEYLFTVSNNENEKISAVVINYQITIKTFHFIPLVIRLYKINNGEELILTCDESHSRNNQNELVCNSDTQELNFVSKIDDQYKLKIEFSSNYNGEEYAGLVDYIDLKIKSFQKT